jgi:hypothetical protein
MAYLKWVCITRDISVAAQPGKIERGGHDRHKIEDLLPWHATETLSRRDADRVEQALAGNRELAQRYELVRQELAGAVLLNETLGAPSARAMEKLFAAISAKEAHGSRCRDSARERLH